MGSSLLWTNLHPLFLSGNLEQGISLCYIVCNLYAVFHCPAFLNIKCQFHLSHARKLPVKDLCTGNPYPVEIFWFWNLIWLTRPFSTSSLLKYCKWSLFCICVKDWITKLVQCIYSGMNFGLYSVLLTQTTAYWPFYRKNSSLDLSLK